MFGFSPGPVPNQVQTPKTQSMAAVVAAVAAEETPKTLKGSSFMTRLSVV